MLLDELAHLVDGANAVDVALLLRLSPREQPMTAENDAIAAARRLARAEGVLSGISSGAALAAVLELANQPRWKGKRCVVMFPDAGERYVSTTLFKAMSS